MKTAKTFAVTITTRRLLKLWLAMGMTCAVSTVQAQQSEAELGQQAMAHRDAGRLDEAAYTLRRLIRTSPRSARAYVELSLIYFQQNKDALAKVALLRGVTYASGDLQEQAIATLNKYANRIKDIPLESANEAREKQEAVDAQREVQGGNNTPQPAAETAPAAKTAPAVQKPLVPKPLKVAPLLPKAGYVIGRCMNMEGKPLVGVQIFMKGVTLAGGENTETFTKTKADGTYSMRVPPGLYAVYATHTVMFAEEKHALRLEALDGESQQQDSTEGVVEDFVWKINGLRPDELAKATSERTWNYAYYGARIYPSARTSLGEYPHSEDKTSLSKLYPADSQLEITLVPQGPLIDGSQGATIVEKLRMGDEGLWTFGMRNIPIGIYTATAKLTAPDGTHVPLRCKVDDPNKGVAEVPWGTSARVTFPGQTEFGATRKLFLAKP